MSLGLSESQQQLTIGLCFFIAGVGSMSFYFGQKAYLLLTGAELNAQFKIVRKGKGERSRRREQKELTGYVSTSSASAASLPKNIPECENQILLLQGHLMVLIEKAVNLGSRSESGGPRHPTNHSIIAEEFDSKNGDSQGSYAMGGHAGRSNANSMNYSDSESPSEMPFSDYGHRKRGEETSSLLFFSPRHSSFFLLFQFFSSVIVRDNW